MEQLYHKSIQGTPFSLDVSIIENKTITWDSTKISIYRNDNLIGEYIRNYDSRGFETFYPFQVDNEWYALYSANYTATRVMKLHENSIEDWCGEDTKSNGFCPAEFYVPRCVHIHQVFELAGVMDGIDVYYADCDYEYTDLKKEFQNPDFVKFEYCNFGLVGGCVWGDDSSIKIRYIDLSKISDKILNITEKFGYWEMPSDLSLKKCISMDDWEPGHDWIILTKAEHINLVTNERG